MTARPRRAHAAPPRRGALVTGAGSADAIGFAAAALLVHCGHAAAVTSTTARIHDRVAELAGDRPFTMTELAAEFSRQAGRAVACRDLPPEAYRAALAGAGVPAPFADLLVDSGLGIAAGQLDDASHALSSLIGRTTTPLSSAVAAALAR